MLPQILWYFAAIASNAMKSGSQIISPSCPALLVYMQDSAVFESLFYSVSLGFFALLFA